MTRHEEFQEQTNNLDSQIAKGLRALDAIVTMLSVTAENSWTVDLALIAGASSVLSDISGRLGEHQAEAMALRNAYIGMLLKGESHE